MFTLDGLPLLRSDALHCAPDLPPVRFREIGAANAFLEQIKLESDMLHLGSQTGALPSDRNGGIR
jgi:hypothetical protein